MDGNLTGRQAIHARQVGAKPRPGKEPRCALPAPLGPEAIQAVGALERGDWRMAYDLMPRLGRCGIAVQRMALSMRERTAGTVAESWQALADAASCTVPGRPSRGPRDQAIVAP